MTTVGPLRRFTCRCCLLILILSLSVLHDLFSVSCTDTATTVDSIVIFGDSLSDTGYDFNTSGCLVPSPDVYWHGRFSNGPAWPDHLARIATARNTSFAPTIRNYAHGGSTTCSASGVSLFVPNLSQQILSFLNSDAAADVDNGTAAAQSISTSNNTCMMLQPLPPRCYRNLGRLFIVFIGHNDLLSLTNEELADPQVMEATVANITACRVAALELLIERLSGTTATSTASIVNATARHTSYSLRSILPSAKALESQPPAGNTAGCDSRHDHIVVWNLAPIDTAPLVPYGLRANMKAAVASHNDQLEASLVALQQRYPRGPVLEVYDLNTVATQEFELVAVDGALNTTVACVRISTNEEEAAGTLFDEAMNVATTATRSDVCSDPNGYVSYDGLHPTSVVHRFAIAEPFAVYLRWL